MKIKNVIFDFGQVIVHFEPEYMVGRYVSDPEDKALLCEVLFDRLYWDKLDKGTITDKEALDAVKTRVPERLWEACDTIYYNWIYNIPEIDGMSIYTELKARNILVRHFTAERICQFNRITIGTRSQMDALLNTLEDIIREQ